MGLFDKFFGRKDKADVPKPGFGNVRTGSGSTLGGHAASAPPKAEPASTPAQPAPRTYEVKSGDNLSKIARQYYGNANEWRKIYDANRDQIKNPDLIYPGQRLLIP
jgi:nucleoid-associated protein YgaU